MPKSRGASPLPFAGESPANFDITHQLVDVKGYHSHSRNSRRAGIKVVLLTEEEDNENGSAPPLLMSSPNLRAAVSNGTGDVPTPFPAVDRVVGSWDRASSSWYGELPPIHGRYGTKHFSDVYGYDCVSYVDF